jgi:hypothetical protein
MIASVARVATKANHQFLSKWLKRATSRLLKKDFGHVRRENRFSLGGLDEKLIQELPSIAFPFARLVLTARAVPTFSTAC